MNYLTSCRGGIRLFLVCAVTLALSGVVAVGQTTLPSASAEKPSEVVKLTEFTVTAEAQAGYGASETMSGSRLPTKIKDLPYNVGVITSEFLNDFAVFDNSEIFTGGVVTQDQDAGGGYSVRGISNTGQLYNGFWLPAGTPVPNALRDRIEILYGPSAGAYGQTAPGGIVNIVSKKPKTRREQVLRYTYGSDQLQDARFESTGPISAKTGYYLLLNHNERSFDRPWHQNRSQTAALTLQHQFDNASILKVDLVASTQRNDAPANRVPYLFNSLTQRVLGVATVLMNQAPTGPNSYRNVDNYSAFATYEKRVSSVFSGRVGAYYYASHSRRFNDVDLTAYDPDPTHFRADPYSATFYGLSRFRDTGSAYTAPNYRKDYNDGGGVQVDSVARYKLFNGAIDNRSLLTVDFSSNYRYINRRGMPTQVIPNPDGSPRVNPDGSLAVRNGVDPVAVPPAPRFAGDTIYWVPTINPLGPSIITDPVTRLPVDIYHVPDPSSAAFTPTSWQKTRTDAFGAMLRHQATIREKLLIFGSVRFDHVSYNNHTISYVPWSIEWHPEWARYVVPSFAARNTGPAVTKYSATAWTPNVGVNYRVTPSLSAYANYSTSFKISTQVVTGATRGSYFLPNERAKGLDYGFKGELQDGKLNWTAGGFYIWQENMSVTVEDGLGGTMREASGTVTSRGLALTGTYVFGRAWAFNAGFYYTDAVWGKTGIDRDLAGRRKAIVPPEIVNFTANYRFSGALKGLRTFALYQYAGRTRADDGGALRPAGSLVVPPGSNNGLRDVMLSAYSTVNAGAAYGFERKAFGRTVRHEVQFNVGNVTDKKFVTYSRGAGDERSYKATYQLAF